MEFYNAPLGGPFLNTLNLRKPDFLVIGVQRSGTTWLWKILKQHPGTDLPHQKEIHYFGGVEKFQLGRQWYYRHFNDLDTDKVTGEASSTYFFDYLPYWGNASESLEICKDFPSIPELILEEMPDVKIVLILRDPVSRSISAYKFWLRKGKLSPRLGLKNTALKFPKLRILEYGYYARYLEIWKKYIPKDRMRILIYEEDVVEYPKRTVKNLYGFLGLENSFCPQNIRQAVHKSWGYSQIVANYYGGKYLPKAVNMKLGNWLKQYTKHRR